MNAANPGAAPINIAMWSGPRNLSTALMRSFAQRNDCQAWDEPFYAAYLAKTGLPHPMHETIVAIGETDPAVIVRKCLEPATQPATVFYQKQMAHHMLDDFPTDWIDRVANAFLIRTPERVLASYVRKHDTPLADELGFHKQHMLFQRVADRTGAPPPVVDAEDIRSDPKGILTALCQALGLAFDPAMLSWPSGPQPEDGIWGEHWYDAIWQSHGFAPPAAPPTALPGRLAQVVDAVRTPYEALAAHKLSPV